MENKKIGLALGGGAVLGAAHVGVLRALHEKNIQPSFVAGTSIGAFVGSLYAFGKSEKEIEKIATQLKWKNVSGFTLSKYGLLSNEKIGDLLLEHIGDKKIEDAHIPLAIIATNASNGDKVVLSQGNLAKAVMASTCIPGIFEPIKLNDLLLIDGGIVENVPIETVRSMGADFTIAVDLYANRAAKTPKNIIDVLMNSFHFMLKNSARYQTDESDIQISPNLSRFSYTDIRQIPKLIEQGYKDAVEALKKWDND